MSKFCPCCHADLSAEIQVWNGGFGLGRKPKIGDVSICSNCTAILSFEIQNGEIGLRMLSDDDVSKLPVEIINFLKLMQGEMRKFISTSTN